MVRNLLVFISVFLLGLSGFAQLPQLRSVDCNRVNTQLYQNLYANITGGTQYRFLVTNNTTLVTDSLTKATRGFNLNEIPSLNRYNCTYDVKVRMDNGSGFGSYGNLCNPSTIALTTDLRASDCGKSLPSIGTTVYASLTSADSWDFQVRNVTAPGTVEDVFGLGSRAFNLTMASAPFQLNNQEYEVRVRTTQGGVIQPWGNWCSIFTPSIITQLRAADCGKNLPSISTTVYAALATADSWDFEVRNVTDLGTTEVISGLASRAFSLTMASSQFQLNNQEYEVRVRTVQGGTTQPWGDWCSIFTPSIISKLRTVDCGRSLTSINYPVYSDVTTADSWDFEVRNVIDLGTTEIINSLDRQFRLTDASALFQLFNQEYEIKVRTIQGGATQPWGDWCSVFTPNVAPPEIIDGCSNTFEYLAYEYITCTDVSAISYNWRLRIGSTVVGIINTGTNQIRIADFLDGGNQPLYDYNTTYNISAQADIGGTWTAYGSACNVSTAAEPHTEVQFECGNTLNMLNQPIIFFAIYNATDYEYEVTDLTGDDGVQTVSKSTKSFKLNELGTYSFGHDYSIRCRVTFKGFQYNYSSACTISSPPPVTKLRSADCPKTLTSSGQKVYGNNNLTVDNPAGLDPTNKYQFRIGAAESDWKSTRDITLIEILGSAPSPSTGYAIEMRVTYDGIEQPYGDACTVTTPSSLIIIDSDDAQEDKNTFVDNSIDIVEVYPNPSNDYFVVKPSKEFQEEKIELRLFDLKGTLIEIPENTISSTGLSEVRIGKDLVNGVYYLHVYSEKGSIESIQLIKL